MLTEQEWITKHQEVFKELYGKEIVIVEINEKEPACCMQETWSKILIKHRASIDKIKSRKRLNNSEMVNERAAVEEMVHEAYYRQWNRKAVAALIGKDRTSLFYYSKFSPCVRIKQLKTA